jgi:hypothetical protein
MAPPLMPAQAPQPVQSWPPTTRRRVGDDTFIPAQR